LVIDMIAMARQERTHGEELVAPAEMPLFELGMMHASGRSGPADLVAAHKWFNLAAMQGHAEAARMRLEISAEMSSAEIAAAQRAAREWLRGH
jgi:TPR repeat protein